ncbi:YciI family protein [Allorhodopirellula heiligendammensis]|uniref:YCII-related domain protein n=1 Tax=Allorhodopirellula heiligendammensis TaxID=2714739 RepID=A0A5C6C926_9BACT|nr:YciI family protein [Allorhodopirellula heiligendammensis]TWU19931.1 YCII-related domain protein [Allorhodopirellula heiligendammensis]
MKYMLLIYASESWWTEDERRDYILESTAICKELETQGMWLIASALDSIATATCVRVRDGKHQVTDGPFAETTEQLGGYCIVDVRDVDEAIDIASRLPPATKGTIEIRPLLPLPNSLLLPERGTADQPPSDAEQRRDYILLMYAQEGAWPPDEHAPALAESVDVCQQLHVNGQFISAAPLQPPKTAYCVRVRHGARAVTDGPFTETKEQLGGYFLIRVANLNEAISIAARIPGSHRGTAEIRPLYRLPV